MLAHRANGTRDERPPEVCGDPTQAIVRERLIGTQTLAQMVFVRRREGVTERVVLRVQHDADDGSQRSASDEQQIPAFTCGPDEERGEHRYAEEQQVDIARSRRSRRGRGRPRRPDRLGSRSGS